MYLEVILREGENSSGLKSMIHKCIMEGLDENGRMIKTWTLEDFYINNIQEQTHTGIRHEADQYENLGWLKLVAGDELLAIDFYAREGEEVTNEQIAIMMCKFASMLRNHFGNHINQISLLKL